MNLEQVTGAKLWHKHYWLLLEVLYSGSKWARDLWLEQHAHWFFKMHLFTGAAWFMSHLWVFQYIYVFFITDRHLLSFIKSCRCVHTHEYLHRYVQTISEKIVSFLKGLSLALIFKWKSMKASKYLGKSRGWWSTGDVCFDPSSSSLHIVGHLVPVHSTFLAKQCSLMNLQSRLNSDWIRFQSWSSTHSILWEVD